MTREETTGIIVGTLEEKGLKWADVAAAVGRHPLWTTAALMGQHTMAANEAEAAVTALGLEGERATQVATALRRVPTRATSVEMPPTDPTIYRFYELILVYGPAIKALIHEEFGDGIMSAIDFSMDMERVPDPNGDRVKLTLNGKFLPYKKF